jgi:Ca2+-binding RTX toxin-like protein
MDTLDYSALTAGVTVNLASRGSQSVGGGYGLTLPAEDMENVAGSATAANNLTGNSLTNVLIGGAANDQLTGGSGRSILIGNAGDDTLVGSAGDDILVGGTGADRIVGSAGNDIMIAGSTNYDFTGYDPAKTNIWLSILAEWENTADSIDVRHTKIAASYLNTSTVHSDTSVDKLTGSSGTNWFFVDNTSDVDPVDTITGNTKTSYFTYIN